MSEPRLKSVPWCCHIDKVGRSCLHPASYELEYERTATIAPENNTHACEANLSWMIDDVFGQRVTSIKIEDQVAWNTAKHAAMRGVDWRAAL